MNWTAKLRNYLSEPTYGHILGLFRIVYGCFMIIEMGLYLKMDVVKNAFILPKVHLSYSYLEFVQPLPEGIMDVIQYVMLACAVLIALGLWFRPASFVFGTLFAYFFFLDKGIFNNHLYLFVMLAFILGFTHADRFFSLRNYFARESSNDFKVQRWEVFLIQMHISIVYFYGGLAKINPDWLFHCQPVRTLVEQMPADHILSSWLKLDFQIAFETYAGLIFDLAIPFLLWYKPTRLWSVLPTLFFHVSNSLTFDDIGIFPFIMIFATVLYFEPDELPIIKNMLPKKGKASLPLLDSAGWVKKLMVAHIVFQLLFPFRGLFLPNPVNWTMIANRFSWRMKSQTRLVDEFRFTIQDGPNGEPLPVEINKFLNPMQMNAVSYDALAAAATAKQLAEEGKRRGMADPVVKASIKVRWNGYPPSYTVNPEVDLSKVDCSPFKKLDWVMPMPH